MTTVAVAPSSLLTLELQPPAAAAVVHPVFSILHTYLPALMMSSLVCLAAAAVASLNFIYLLSLQVFR